MTAVHASSLRSTRQPPATSTVLRWELDSGTSTSFLRAHHVSRPSVLGAQADQPGDARINFVLLRPLTLTCSDQLRCTDDHASRLFQLSTSPTFHRTSSRSSLSHTRNTLSPLCRISRASQRLRLPLHERDLSTNCNCSRLIRAPADSSSGLAQLASNAKCIVQASSKEAEVAYTSAQSTGASRPPRHAIA